MKDLLNLILAGLFILVFLEKNIMMQDEILDEQEPNDYPKYGIKSFHQFLYSMIVILVFVGFILINLSSIVGLMAGTFFLIVPLIIFLSAFISNILGLNNALKSKRRKERSHWKKTVGRIGNIVLGIFFLLMLLAFLWMTV